MPSLLNARLPLIGQVNAQFASNNRVLRVADLNVWLVGDVGLRFGFVELVQNGIAGLR